MMEGVFGGVTVTVGVFDRVAAALLVEVIGGVIVLVSVPVIVEETVTAAVIDDDIVLLRVFDGEIEEVNDEVDDIVFDDDGVEDGDDPSPT